MLNLQTFYNLQDFSSRGIIIIVIRRIKNRGDEEWGEEKTFGINQGSSPN